MPSYNIMQHHHTTHFQTRKSNCLSKRDKSSAGRIDPFAVEICDSLNRREEYYTTSSCAGRCFLYRGDGIKSWHGQGGPGAGAAVDDNGGVVVDDAIGPSRVGGGEGGAGRDDDDDDDDDDVDRRATVPGGGGKLGFFKRYRISHDLIREPSRYFDLSTLAGGEDPTGGGDPIPSVGQFDHGNNAAFRIMLEGGSSSSSSSSGPSLVMPADTPVWLRYEPFILHVMCRSLGASSALMALARPAFKNVGLTSWHDGGDGDDNNHGNGKNNRQCKGGGPRYLVAIWGDEGLDMPLSLPSSPGCGLFYNPEDGESVKNAEWLAQLVNERHARNWKKIERFVESMRSLEEAPIDSVDEGDGGVVQDIDRAEWALGGANSSANGSQSERASSGLPRSYDGK